MDLNSINANINRLLTNIWAVISFLKEFAVDGAKNVSITYINADGSESVKTMPNISKFFDSNGFGMKNYIINGGFDVWQRGVYDITVNRTFFADRFRDYFSPNFTAVKETIDLPNGFSSGVKIGVNTDNKSSRFYYKIESKDAAKLYGKKATLSFYVKSLSTNVNSVYGQLSLPSNVDDYSEQSTLSSYSADIPTSGFTRVIKTFDFTTATDVKNGLMITFDIGAINTTDNVIITGIQLEEGEVATPFEHRPYGLELSLCQRYYEKIDNKGVLPVTADASNERGFYTYKVPKRVTPSVTINFDAGSDATFAYDINGGYQNGNHSSASSFSVVADAEL